MKRPSRETRKPNNGSNQPQSPELPPITLGIDQIDENRLHPIGIPGINLLEPNIELIDPTDWFMMPVTKEWGGLNSVDITVSDDGCIICVSVSGSLGWLEATEGNGVGFCFVKPECRKPPEPPPPPVPPEYPPGIPKPCPMPKGGGLTRIEFVLYESSTSINLCDGIGESATRVSDPWYATIMLPPNTEWLTSIRVFHHSGEAKCPYGKPQSTLKFSAIFDVDLYDPSKTYIHAYAGGETVTGTQGFIGQYPDDGMLLYVESYNMTVPVSAVVIGDNDNDDLGNEPPPPKPPEDDKMTCCRNQQNSDALLRKIAKCVGTHQLPATLPKSFNRKVGGTTRITSIPEFVQWNAVQLSDLIGEFPKKIKIKDANLLEDGDQGLEIELPNLAEAIADMYGISVRSTAVSEVLMAFATRMAVEICSVKSATLVGQSYSKATALALGYKFEEEKVKVPFGFNFTADASKLEDFLENSEKKITTWVCKEPSSAWEYFERLMYVAGLVKAQTLRKEGNIGDTINRIKDLGLLGKDQIDDFLEKLKENGFYNVDDNIRRPDVEKL